jgi:two-component sensor histidine kinase
LTSEPLRILHVDDDPALSRLVGKMLARQGYAVESVATGEAGLARIAQGGIDVVVLDHYLETGTGMAVLRALQGRPDAPAIVYVTGSAETAIAVEALKLGAADYVHKSVEENFFTLLASAVDQAVERVRLLREKARAEREIRAARDRAEMLLSEVNHRVANSLAIVASLVRMQASAVSDVQAKNALAETETRIAAIAGLHRKLYTSDDIGSVDLDAYLASMAQDLDVAMRQAGHGSRLRLDLQPFALPTDRAVSVGMVVTELLTNAYKYAYPGQSDGEVRLSLHLRDPHTAVIAVEDDGIGWSGSGSVKGTGLGSRIIRSMASTLDTSVTFGDGGSGTRAEIVVALPPPQAAPSA